MAISKINRRNRIKKGIRKKIHGNSERPRLTVFRSNREIYAQIINDDTAETLVSFSSRNEAVDSKTNKTETAEKVGEELGKLALEKGIEKVTFDRNGYLFHGRIKALAEGARKAGLQF